MTARPRGRVWVPEVVKVGGPAGRRLVSVPSSEGGAQGAGQSPPQSAARHSRAVGRGSRTGVVE